MQGEPVDLPLSPSSRIYESFQDMRSVLRSAVPPHLAGRRPETPIHPWPRLTKPRPYTHIDLSVELTQRRHGHRLSMTASDKSYVRRVCQHCQDIFYRPILRLQPLLTS